MHSSAQHRMCRVISFSAASRWCQRRNLRRPSSQLYLFFCFHHVVQRLDFHIIPLTTRRKIQAGQVATVRGSVQWCSLPCDTIRSWQFHRYWHVTCCEEGSNKNNHCFNRNIAPFPVYVAVREFFQRKFNDLIVSRGSTHQWPACSPDLSGLVLSFWSQALYWVWERIHKWYII